MRVKIILLCSLLITRKCLGHFACWKDLYWIDYFGDIPQNAVKAGIDQNFKPVYVGQAFIQNKEIVPVAIHPGNPVVQFANYGRTYETQNYVKVLCTFNKKNLKWIPMTSGTYYDNLYANMVIGGIEDEEMHGIGRAYVEDEGTIVGKVVNHRPPTGALLHFPSGSKEKDVKEYEVLAYDCDEDLFK